MSRDFLCASCVDYLIAYHPLWLEPALLPGPSLIDLAAPRESPLVSADLKQIEWESPREERSAADAVRLVHLLGFEGNVHPVVSVGDAEILHRFLREGRRSTPIDAEERDALAMIYRYLSKSDWMPSHLASEYRLRADVLGPPAAEPLPEVGGAEIARSTDLIESVSSTQEATEPLPELPSMDLEPAEEEIPLPAPDPFRPEPVPSPEPPLPLPEPPEPQPVPEPEPEPEEPHVDAAKWTEFETMKNALDSERAETEAWTRSRSEELRAKETALVERERTLLSKQKEVEAQARAVTDRLVALEKDGARAEVLRFLGRIPGMSEPIADVIASAFPDMASLQSADGKALTQCQGVTETIARAIRYELVPGEVDEEQQATRLREEAQAFLEEGNNEAALACYDRLLRDRPQEIGPLFDRAGILIQLGRQEEALQSYRRVLDMDRKNRRAWFERANLLYGLGRLADAIDSLREALRIEPSKAGDIVLKAEQLRRDGHPNEAAILFQAILDVNPAEMRAVLGLGDAFMDLGDTDAAEALFTQALGKSPQNATIVFRKGEFLERKGRWGAAIQYYNRAIALKWDFVSPWLAKAKILLEHDHPAEALECFDKVTSFNPDLVEAWAGKARAHSILGNREAAAAALERAANIDGGHPSVRDAREVVGAPQSPEAEASEGEEEAMEGLGETPAGEPREEMDFPSLLKAFEEIEEEPEPAPEPPSITPDFHSFVESIEPDEEGANVLLQLAELALEAGDARMALLRYEQALAQDDRSADAWTGKGVALQQLERYHDALEAYDRALMLDPNHALAQKWRATCVRHLGSEAQE